MRRLVSHCLSDEQFIERLILEIAGRTAPKDRGRSIEMLSPEVPAPLEEFRRHPEELTEGTLTEFVLACL